MSVTKTDWAALYEKFAPQNGSALSYAAAVIELTGYLRDKLDEYELQEGAVIAEINALRLTDEFNFSLPNLLSKARAKIKKIRQQAIALRDGLQAEEDFARLAELENQPRPSFELLADLLIETARSVSAPVKFYEHYAEFVENAAASYHQTLYVNRQYSGYDTPRYDNSLANFFNYVRCGHLRKKLDSTSTAADYVLREFTDFRNKLNDLYRKPLEADRREHAVPPLMEEFRLNIGGIASALKSSEERQWLIDWAENLK